MLCCTRPVSALMQTLYHANLTLSQPLILPKITLQMYLAGYAAALGKHADITAHAEPIPDSAFS